MVCGARGLALWLSIGGGEVLATCALSTLGAVWLVAMVAQVMVRSLALVAVHVEVTKHLLSATFAPMSAKNCLERFMPCTVAEACLSLLAYMKRSSARTLGSTLCCRI